MYNASSMNLICHDFTLVPYSQLLPDSNNVFLQSIIEFLLYKRSLMLIFF